MPYIYLVHTRASKNINENVYKFGKTEDFSKRLCGYDKGTVPLLLLFVNDCDCFEVEILKMFSVKFTKRTDYGCEYFEGDLKEMLELIMTHYNSNLKQHYMNTCSLSVSSSSSSGEEIQKEDNLSEIIKEKLKLVNKLNKYTVNNIDEKKLKVNLRGLAQDDEFKSDWGRKMFFNLSGCFIKFFKDKSNVNSS
jgi:hypothetical protein